MKKLSIFLVVVVLVIIYFVFLIQEVRHRPVPTPEDYQPSQPTDSPIPNGKEYKG